MYFITHEITILVRTTDLVNFRRFAKNVFIVLSNKKNITGGLQVGINLY